MKPVTCPCNCPPVAIPESMSIPADAELSTELNQFDTSLQRHLWRLELATLAAIIVLFNLPLLFSGFSNWFIYHPVPVAAGEWWRLFTHPFVHVSPYHLALDAAAFFLAYIELKHRTLSSRIVLIASAAAGGLLGALAASQLVLTHGLCGLSGIAHGLTAVVSLELLRRANDRLSQWTAALCFIGVVGKSVFEALSGNVLFASWHLGSLGTPIAACHAGGILGALAAWILLRTPEPHPGGETPPSSEWNAGRFRLTTR